MREQSNILKNMMVLNSTYTLIEVVQRFGVVKKELFDTLINEYAGGSVTARRYSPNHNALNYFGHDKVQEVDVALTISGS